MANQKTASYTFTVLITGGAGFIGSALVRHLIQNTDSRVINVDKLTYAGNFIRTIEERQGLKIACPEEVAYRTGFIDSEQVCRIAEPLKKSGHGRYLMEIAKGQSEP
jgi:dTDP-D-glucose 4,6-dehydratase